MSIVKPPLKWLFQPTEILKKLAVLNAAARLRNKSQKVTSLLRDTAPKTDTPKDNE